MLRTTIPTLRQLLKRERKYALIAFSSFLVVFIAGSFYLDPFNFKNSNFTLNTSDEEIKSFAQNIVETCVALKGQDKPDCYRDELRSFTKEYGFVTGEKMLSSIQELDADTRTCHVLSHYIAREAYVREPSNFYKLLDSINVNTCGSGFLHGILEAYAAEHPEVEMDGAFAEKMCNRGNDDYRKRTCIHLMGHLLLISTYGDVNEALNLCRLTLQKNQFNCFDGIFMEDHQKLALFQHGMSPLPEKTPERMREMERKCLSYTDNVVAKACWLEMAEPYAHTYGYSASTLYRECSKAPKIEFQEICYRKAGTALATYYRYDKQEDLVSICAYYKKNLNAYNSCVTNITTSLMYTSPKFINRGIALCSNIEETSREVCYTDLVVRLKEAVRNNKERAPYCLELPNDYISQCTN